MGRVSIRLKKEGPVTDIRMTSRFWGIPLYGVHAFFVDGLLIDTGFAHGRHEFLTLCDTLQPEMIFNTHHHEDHTGNNFWLTKRYGILPLAHPQASSYMKAPSQWIPFYRRFVWGMPPSSEMSAVDSEIKTQRFRFLVIPTPGHTDDHICLYEPNEGWLFSGDLFINEEVKYLRKDEDIDGILASLKQIATLRLKTMFCSFSGLIENPETAIRHKIAYFQHLNDQIAEGVRQGLPPHKLQRRLLGRGDRYCFVSSGELCKKNLIKAFLKPKRG